MKSIRIAQRAMTRGRWAAGAALMLGAATTLCALDAHAACQQQPVGALTENVTGNAELCTNASGAQGRLQLTGLTSGDAYTVWFIYIENEAQCTADGVELCFGENDPTAVPEAAFGRFGNVIAPANGQAQLSGAVPGLRLSPGSEVEILVKGHGVANSTDNLARARQLLTPEDVGAGAPNLGFVGGPVADFAGAAIFSF